MLLCEYILSVFVCARVEHLSFFLLVSCLVYLTVLRCEGETLLKPLSGGTNSSISTHILMKISILLTKCTTVE